MRSVAPGYRMFGIGKIPFQTGSCQRRLGGQASFDSGPDLCQGPLDFRINGGRDRTKPPPLHNAKQKLHGEKTLRFTLFRRCNQNVVILANPWPATGEPLLHPGFDSAILDSVQQEVDAGLSKITDGDNVPQPCDGRVGTLMKQETAVEVRRLLHKRTAIDGDDTIPPVERPAASRLPDNKPQPRAPCGEAGQIAQFLHKQADIHGCCHGPPVFGRGFRPMTALRGGVHSGERPAARTRASAALRSDPSRIRLR